MNRFLKFEDKSTWEGRSDNVLGERFFQRVELVKSIENSALAEYGIIGFLSDIGIMRNRGRVGASQGPQKIRQFLKNLALPDTKLKIADYGNLIPEGEDLEAAQEALGLVVQRIHSKKQISIVLGGGHETAYGHFLGLKDCWAKKPRIGILNLDAHFDLRPIVDNKGSSGTPFLQIANWCKRENKAFSYLVLGIQPSANTLNLYETAKNLDASFVSAKDMLEDSSSWELRLEAFLNSHDGIYLSLCLDVLDISFAPGVSAPSVFGLNPQIILKILKKVKESGKLLAFDVVELSPPHDLSDMTARLAGRFVFEMIF